MTLWGREPFPPLEFWCTCCGEVIREAEQEESLAYCWRCRWYCLPRRQWEPGWQCWRLSPEWWPWPPNEGADDDPAF